MINPHDEPVAEVPAQLGHVAEVLAVEADDEGREEQERRDRGQPFHDLVLVVRDLRLGVVADAGEQVACEVEPVRRAQELVVGRVEGDLDLVGEDLRPVFDLDASRRSRGARRRASG